MKKEQKHNILFQWVLPIVVVGVVIVILMVVFSGRATENSKKVIEKQFNTSAENCIKKIRNQIYTLDAVGNVSLPILVHHQNNNDVDGIEDVLNHIMEESAAREVVYIAPDDSVYACGEFVSGISSIDDIVYLDSIKEKVADLKNEHKFISEKESFSQNNEIVSISQSVGENQKRNLLLLYYNLDDISELLTSADVNNSSSYFIMTVDGDMVKSYGTQNTYTKMANVWAALDATHNSEAKKAMRKVKGNASAAYWVNIDNDDKVMFFSDMGMEDLSFVILTNQTHVKDLIRVDKSIISSALSAFCMVIIIYCLATLAINIVGVFRNNKESKELEDKADTDQLTGLTNKLATERKIKEYMQSHPDSQSMMCILDIDNFKKVNDTLGHAFGDELLSTLGHTIGANFRASDIIGRTGGDEFTVFIKDLKDESIIKKEEDKLINYFRNFQAGEYVKYSATASIGAAIFPRDGQDFETLYKAADAGLYLAKKRGKNQLAYYEETKGEVIGSSKDIR